MKSEINRAIFKRAVAETTKTARRRIWVTRDGRHRVVESKSLYGLPLKFYAQAWDDGCQCWTNLSTHNKAAPALAAVAKEQRHA